jgi:Holliday junction DNA helicase RuvA
MIFSDCQVFCKLLSLLQNSVSFAQALAVFRPTGYKTAFFNGCCCKTEVLQQPLFSKFFHDLQQLFSSVFFSIYRPVPACYTDSMFNSLRGVLSGKTGDTAYLETGGVEWEIAMPATDIETLPPAGGECRIFTWLYHREDQMRLFGFTGETRRNTFLDLLKVEGIGPKGALKIMGGISQEELERALEAGDLARLEAVPGLGKKTAQKMLLSLKGKLVHAPAAAASAPSYGDLVEALAEMGYDRRAAQEALARAEANLPPGIAETDREKLLFKEAIVYLSGL